MRKIVFIVGLIIGIIIPLTLDQIYIYRDTFGALDLGLGEQLTLFSLAPNDRLRALIVETPRVGIGDRNFEVRIQEKGKSGMTTIFNSPDEGSPVESERIFWSPDSSQLILVGRKFIATPIDKAGENFRLPNGEVLYLLYDIPKQQLYCHLGLEYYNCLPIPSNTLEMFKTNHVF